MRLGVPQLSLGEKAILTASPDYVRDIRDIVHLVMFWLLSSLGVWLPWVPTRDTAQFDSQIRGRIAQDQQQALILFLTLV